MSFPYPGLPCPGQGTTAETDIDRILYAEGQEELYDSDDVSPFFQEHSLERITALRQAIIDQQWHLMEEEQRNFSADGCRRQRTTTICSQTSGMEASVCWGILLGDIDDLESERERKQLRRPAHFPGLPEDDGGLSGSPIQRQ